MGAIKYLERDNKQKIAYRKIDANESGESMPTVLFCGGFRSDMEGTKAQFLEDLCKDRGQAYVRFDYSGHGSSSGSFDEGTIGQWKDDSLAVLDELTQGPVVIAGSSMGGWIALLMALERPSRLAGIIGLAPAPDFTREIYNDQLSDEQRDSLDQSGYIEIPNDYSPEPYKITKLLLQEGESHCILNEEIKINVPVKIIQGMQDTDVPWQKAYRIKNAMNDPEQTEVILIETGDHSLSRQEDLELLKEQVIKLS